MNKRSGLIQNIMIFIIISNYNKSLYKISFKLNQSQALLEFAESKGIKTTAEYCDDLAWTGTFDSKAFANLNEDNKKRIVDRVNAEEDPYSTLENIDGNEINNGNSYIGNPCK